eukprot:6279124-Amphidinium_carterae.1
MPSIACSCINLKASTLEHMQHLLQHIKQHWNISVSFKDCLVSYLQRLGAAARRSLESTQGCGLNSSLQAQSVVHL